MGRDLTEFAQKLAQAARAGLAIEKERLRKILAERQKEEVASESPTTTQENQTNS